VSDPQTTTVDVNGRPCRVWRKGSGPRIAFLAGLGGLPKWIPFLDRLAESREVVVPSVPGFPGGLGHDSLDSHLDWMLAIHDLLRAAGLGDEPCDLVGSSVGGALAADVAAIWPGLVRRLVLISPLGLFDADTPGIDPFALRIEVLPEVLCVHGERWSALRKRPEGGNSIEWPIEQARALEAGARILWPNCDTGLARRLPRIAAPTLLLRGSEDGVVPTHYVERMHGLVGSGAAVETVAGAGHLAELDEPDAVAAAILKFTA